MYPIEILSFTRLLSQHYKLDFTVNANPRKVPIWPLLLENGASEKKINRGKIPRMINTANYRRKFIKELKIQHL